MESADPEISVNSAAYSSRSGGRRSSRASRRRAAPPAQFPDVPIRSSRAVDGQPVPGLVDGRDRPPDQGPGPRRPQEDRRDLVARISGIPASPTSPPTSAKANRSQGHRRQGGPQEIPASRLDDRQLPRQRRPRPGGDAVREMEKKYDILVRLEDARARTSSPARRDPAVRGPGRPLARSRLVPSRPGPREIRRENQERESW